MTDIARQEISVHARCNVGRQGAEQARLHLDQRNAQRTSQARELDAVRGDDIGSARKFGSQFAAGCTAADDGYANRVARTQFGARAKREQAAMEALGVGLAVERMGVGANARCAKIVVDGANADDQRRVIDRPARGDLKSGLVDQRGEPNLLAQAVHRGELAKFEAEVMLACLLQKIEFVFAWPQGAGRDLVQQGFPQVRERRVNQHDFGFFAASHVVAESCRQFEAAGAAADDDHAMQRRQARRLAGERLRQLCRPRCAAREARLLAGNCQASIA